MSRRKVLDALRHNFASLVDAARAGGAAYQTLNLEMNRDPEFARQVRQAEGEGKLKLVKNAGEKKPDWLLATKWPEEFANKAKYTLKQIDEAVQRIFNELICMIPDEKREHATERIKQAIIALAIQGGEFPGSE